VIKADSQPAAASSGSLGPTGLGKKGFGGAHLCALAVAFVLVGCSGSDKFGTVDPRYGVSSSARLVAPGEPVPKGGGVYRVGAPYSIGGRTYVPGEDPRYRAEGLASWYGDDFHGRQTANGEIYDMNSMSAAHTTLPMPSHVRVTNLSNNRSVIVRINDRGPYHSDRIIDVSVKAAILLGFYGSGLAPVRVEYVGAAPLEGSDDNLLIATLRQGEPAPAPSLIRVASTKPFVPELAIRSPSRDVPVPPSRPYSLGEGQVVSNYRPGSGVSSVTRPPAADPDNSVIATPMRRAFSPNAPAQSEMQSGNLQLPTLMPATNVRDLY
jgi:rare lipoprotein A